MCRGWVAYAVPSCPPAPSNSRTPPLAPRCHHRPSSSRSRPNISKTLTADRQRSPSRTGSLSSFVSKNPYLRLLKTPELPPRKVRVITPCSSNPIPKGHSAAIVRWLLSLAICLISSPHRCLIRQGGPPVPALGVPGRSSARLGGSAHGPAQRRGPVCDVSSGPRDSLEPKTPAPVATATGVQPTHPLYRM